MSVTKTKILEALANKIRAKNALVIAANVVRQAQQELANTTAMPGHPADIAYAEAAVATAIAELQCARTAYRNTSMIYKALISQRQTDKEVIADVNPD